MPSRLPRPATTAYTNQCAFRGLGAASPPAVVAGEAHLAEAADGGDDAHDDGRSVRGQGRYREQLVVA